ncbi:lipopolysaccharide biosynthesis protein [Streptomyces sp. YIM S03343]
MTRRRTREAAWASRWTAPLRGEASLALLGVVGGAVIALLGSLLVARLLAPAERGRYASVVVFTTLCLTLLEMGGEVGVLRRLGERREESAEFAAGYLAWACLVSAAVAVASYTAGGWTPGWLRPAWLLGLCAGAAVFGGLVFRLTTGILMNGGRLRRLVVARTAGNCGPVLACLLCAPLGPPSALEVAAVSFLAQTAVNCFLLFRLEPAGQALSLLLRGGRDRTAWRRSVALVWRRGTVDLHALNGATFALQRSDQMALSVAGADRTLGIYAVATNVSEVVSYLPAALFPLVARGRPGRPVDLRRILLLLTLCVAVCTPLAYWALPLVYGEAYRAARPVVLVLVPATGVLAVGRLLQGVELRDTGRRRSLAVIAVTAAVFEFAAVFACGTSGPVAAALACTAGYGLFTAWITLSRTPSPGRPSASTKGASGRQAAKL